MSCYLRHMKEVLAEAGIEVTKANRQQIDLAFHRIIGLDEKHCPSAWKMLKAEIADDARRKELARKLREAVGLN